MKQNILNPRNWSITVQSNITRLCFALSLIGFILFYSLSSSFKHQGEELVVFLGFLGTIVTIGEGVMSRWHKLAWKRLQYTKDMTHDIFDEMDFVHALRILDNNVYYLDDVDGGHEVNDENFIKALKSTDSQQDKDANRDPNWKKGQQKIVWLLDGMLENLRFFEHAIESNLVDKNDLRIFLSYWIRVIFPNPYPKRDDLKPKDWWRNSDCREEWLKYILENDFRPALNLCFQMKPKRFYQLYKYAMNHADGSLSVYISYVYKKIERSGKRMEHHHQATMP